MSRVHDALRKAEQMGVDLASPLEDYRGASHTVVPGSISSRLDSEVQARDEEVDAILARVQEIPYRPAAESHLISLDSPQEMPGEEFRSLRTRLNHLQSQQKLSTVVVTSASPAEGKSFTAANLAIVQAQLSDTPVLLADLDLRRPSMHRLLQVERGFGFSDYILGEQPIENCVRRFAGTSLYFMSAGSQVKNPLELLNQREVRSVIAERFPRIFKWSIIDSPPMLFSADANLLATLADGTLIVVRIGATTYDNILRAMQSLCENKVMGIVVNGARAAELYSKFTYYYNKQD